MGLLDSTSTQPSLGINSNNFMDFLKSPQALSLAAGLLQAGGSSHVPVSLGQAFGMGIQNMQNQNNKDITNNYTKTLTNEVNNKMALAARQQAAMQQYIQQLANPQAPDRTSLNSQSAIASDPQKMALAGLLMQTGNYNEAAKVLTNSKVGRPIAAVDASGKPVFLQQDTYGNVQPISGYTPLPKAGTSLSFDPQTGQMLFQQGVTPNNISDLVKDPTKSPARGGQGGTYIDSKTGQMISTNAAKNVTQDQLAVGAFQRVEPQLDTLVKTLPQFQQASTQATSYMQGLANKYLGTNYELPSQKAEGLAKLQSAPEALLKAFGLQSTNEALEMMKATIEPTPGESPKGYKDRVMRALVEMKGFQDQAKDRLANGIVVKEGNNKNTTVRRYNLSTGRIE